MKRKVGLIITGYFLLFFLTLGIYSLTGNEINKNRLDKEYKNSKENNVIENAIDYEEIKKEINTYQTKFSNEEIIGTLKIPGTTLDTVLVQGEDNDFYLNHAIDKKYNIYGSIYLDYRINTTDRKLIFYGHNSKNLITEFKELEKFLDWNFFNENQHIHLVTDAGRELYQIFSVMVVTDNRHTMITFNDKGYSDHLKWMKENSIYDTLVDVESFDKIITLQTCYYEPLDSFLIVNAKKIGDL